MLRRVILVRTDVSEELSASFIRVTVSTVPSSPILVTDVSEEFSASFIRVTALFLVHRFLSP
jgi:hypothetical protein